MAFEADTTVAVGIGFGETAYSAEINAFSCYSTFKRDEEARNCDYSR
ncbi:hypothetical protein RCO48_37650 [Peribacillus frigoritolerans]|nr:hypothetical protein [Peribacillus frigoritolerans]